jgi:N utilization substance protein B
MFNESDWTYPLSKTKKIRGSRRLVREKALQILVASDVAQLEWSSIFDYIFLRKFNFGDNEEKSNKILTQDEVQELESDIPIIWNNEEIQFGMQLVEAALSNREFSRTMIKKYADNWEFERIAPIDRTLMEIAIAEIISFQDIPPKVSINEAIDIAKKYSTAKSGLFINGILDSALEELTKENKINKSGRGSKS